MRYLVTGQQMKQIDQYTIQTIGIPSLALMERAALAVAKEAENLAGKADHIWAVCGTGNNGADGIGAARMLALKGYSVTIIMIGNQEKGTREFHVQKEIAENLDITVVEWKDFLPGRCDLLIDAIFGVGLHREIEGEYREVLETLQKLPDVKVIGVDMPSGINSSTGQIMGISLKADITVTFGYEKLGNVLYPGREYCGKVVVADIGFPSISLQQAEPFAWIYENEDLDKLPVRPRYSNKGTFGKVLVVAGAKGMSGAAGLAGLAAYRTGAGLVKLMTVEDNREILQQQLPEAILTLYRPEDLYRPETENLKESQTYVLPDRWEERMERECAWADVIVLGPGLGQEPYVKRLVESVLISAYVPIVLDADGLNIIAANPKLEQYYTENIIITPHLGEMARLTGKTVSEIQERLLDTSLEYSSSHGIICVLKDAATLVSNREGQCYVNTSGNSCMAKAGSGDVLAGTIAGLAAQGMEPFDAACMGVYIHGLAGDRYRDKHGAVGMLARELAEEIGDLGKYQREKRGIET